MHGSDDLGTAGRELYDSVTADWELNAAEHGLLVRLCATADVVTRLEAECRKARVTLPDGRVNPLFVEHRQQSITFARLATALRLPEGDSDDRPQRRGIRGTYGVRGVVS